LKFFEAIKLLFPRSRAFELFVDNDKRKMMKAISVLPEDIRHEAELVYMDLFPDTTRFPEKWENTFAVYFAAKELPGRRNILESLWKINNGGQSAVFLEEVLQSLGNLSIVENIPLINPFQVYASLDLAVCDNEIMICDLEEAVCDYRLGDQGFEPFVLRNDTMGLYSIPEDPAYWSTCFFICKQAWRDGGNHIVYVELQEMDITWKNYIEYLILRIKPVHTTAVVFIDWKEEVND
jgi:hypothetical protein